MPRPQARPIGHPHARNRSGYQYDFSLLTACILLMMIGLVMVASSSITIAENLYSDPLYYFWRQLISVLIGLGGAFLIINTPLVVWQQLSSYFLFIGLIFLVAVLVPGIGREVNGSMRWIDLGPLNVQSSEIVKFCVIIYLAGYMVRHEEGLRTTFSGFIRPIAVVTLVAGLLLLEPDYGSAVVIFATALGMLFMGGVPLSRFFLWVLAASVALVSIAVLSPYRLQRLTSFIDPWQDPFNTGFQLSQALIAFGRGEWFGVGLGSSVQKLFYLPEAHTDFVYAVLAEEFGLIGAVLIITLYFFVIWRAFLIGETAQQYGRLFSAYLAYGIGLLIGIQAFINIGVNMGVLPTKGLTLPLISYGNNSLVITVVLVTFLLRVEMENRMSKKPSAPVSRPGPHVA
jgi:cell division protein FtsW